MNLNNTLAHAGGITRVSRACGISTQAVSMWILRGSIPWRHRATVATMLLERGQPVPAGFYQ